jgi:hypothetical protein
LIITPLLPISYAITPLRQLFSMPAAMPLLAIDTPDIFAINISILLVTPLLPLF